MPAIEFDIALSFAGTDRPYAEALEKELTRLGLRVFYDRAYQSALIGSVLTERLPEVYRDLSAACVPIVSQAYLDSVWARLERRAALEAALTRQNHVLPIRLDDVEIPGIGRTVGYIDGRQNSVQTAALLLCLRLLRTQSNTSPSVSDQELAIGSAQSPYFIGAPAGPGIALPKGQMHLRQIVLRAIAEAQVLLAGFSEPDGFRNTGVTMQYLPRSSPGDALSARLVDLVRTMGFVGPAYSIQIGILAPTGEWLAHPEVSLGSNISEALPENVVQRILHQRDDSAFPDGRLFSWIDNIESPVYSPANAVRYSIGLVRSFDWRTSRAGLQIPVGRALMLGELHAR